MHLSKTLRRAAPLAVIALVFAACGTADLTATTTSTTADGQDHDHSEDTRTREWDADFPAPDLQIEIMDTETLLVSAPGFVFTGADVFDPVPGKGHAHLYVDGDLMTMVYGPEFKMPQLEPGDHHVIVTLSTNDHLDYTVDGETISAMTNLTIEDEGASSPTTEPAESNATEIVIKISNGEVDRPADRLPVELGSTVVLTVTTDVMDEVHIHGYDLTFHAMGEAVSFEFVADVPGIFEVELEESGLLLFELQVG